MSIELWKVTGVCQYIFGAAAAALLILLLILFNVVRDVQKKIKVLVLAIMFALSVGGFLICTFSYNHMREQIEDILSTALSSETLDGTRLDDDTKLGFTGRLENIDYCSKDNVVYGDNEMQVTGEFECTAYADESYYSNDYGEDDYASGIAGAALDLYYLGGEKCEVHYNARVAYNGEIISFNIVSIDKIEQ